MWCAGGTALASDRTKMIGLIMGAVFVLWFLIMGFSLVEDMIGFSW